MPAVLLDLNGRYKGAAIFKYPPHLMYSLSCRVKLRVQQLLQWRFKLGPQDGHQSPLFLRPVLLAILVLVVRIALIIFKQIILFTYCAGLCPVNRSQEA